MTSERADAYGRVMKALADLGPTKLHDDEQQVIRDAADALLFEESHRGNATGRAALAEARELTDRLVEADRLVPETAERLLDDLAGCGHASLMAA
jgi:hypothetical protein